MALLPIAGSYNTISSASELVRTPVSLAAFLIFLAVSLLLQLVRLYHNRVQSRELGHNALTTQLLNMGSMSGGAVPRQIHCHMSPRTHNNPTPPLSQAPLSPRPPNQAPNPKNLLPPNPPQLSRFARLKSSIASARGCMIRIWSDVGHAATCGYIYSCTFIYNYQSLIKSHLFFAYLCLYDYQSFIKSHLFFAFALSAYTYMWGHSPAARPPAALFKIAPPPPPPSAASAT